MVNMGLPHAYIAHAAADALEAFDAISPQDVESLLKIASPSPDPELQRKLFDLIAKKGHEAALHALSDILLSDAASIRTRERVALALAIAEAPDSPQLVAEIGAATFLELPPEVAVAAAMAVGRHGSKSQVLSIAHGLSDDPDRRVLLVGLAIGVSHRKNPGDLIGQITRCLPLNHPISHVLSEEQQEQLLPSETLDDLGAIQYVNPTLEYLSGFIQARPAFIG